MVDSVSNAASTANNYTTTSKTDLGKDDFLKLMIAQLKNQDPLNPMEGTEFTAQLAQFSSLEQLKNMSDSLETSINANFQLTQAVNNTMSATLIGKAVKLDTSTIQYNGQDETYLGYTLPADAKDVTVNIYNESGTLIKTIENADNDKGDHKLSWDFTDNNGEKIGYGNYRFEVVAKTVNNEDMVVNQFSYGIIDSVRYTENGTMLVINNVEYSLSDVTEILNVDAMESDSDKDSEGGR
ncbi:MAG: flagellar hook capping FlgD N-terminal domain-containing protein [bacterium]